MGLYVNHEDIRIGTMVNKGAASAEYIRQILPYGFESFELNFWKTLGHTDLKRLAGDVREVLAGSDAIISSLGIYGNPLAENAEGETCRADWVTCIESAGLFGCNIVAGFAGRVAGKPIPESMPRYREVFGPLAKRAADCGIKICFENCDMGGTWANGDYNIAQIPAAWERMFDALPADNIGLEWEPAHQLTKLIDPMPQIRKWGRKFFHVHGKDATIRRDVIGEHGIAGDVPFCFNRMPGFGDTNWSDVITELRLVGFTGCIDIEGWHDPIYRGDLEMTGQVHSLHYLKQCRGGAFVPNPTVAL